MFPIFDPYLATRRQLMNLFPKGKRHPFLYKLSYLIYYLTQFHLLRNPIPLTWGKFVDTSFIMGGGLPYTISYGEYSWDRRVILSLSRAIGSKSTQEQSVSVIHLESLLKCLVGPFHHLRTLGLYAVCSFHLRFKVLLTCTKSTMKSRPLSDPILVGNPNPGTISLSRHGATSDALSV